MSHQDNSCPYTLPWHMAVIDGFFQLEDPLYEPGLRANIKGVLEASIFKEFSVVRQLI